MKLSVDRIQVRTALCALGNDLSSQRQKLSFIRKLSCSHNSVYYELSCELHWAFFLTFLLFHFIVLCLSCLSAAVLANKDLYNYNKKLTIKRTPTAFSSTCHNMQGPGRSLHSQIKAGCFLEKWKKVKLGRWIYKVTKLSFAIALQININDLQSCHAVRFDFWEHKMRKKCCAAAAPHFALSERTCILWQHFNRLYATQVTVKWFILEVGDTVKGKCDSIQLLVLC